MATIGWKQFGIRNISISPQRYTSSLQWQIGRKLTASRLAVALSEDSHSRVSVGDCQEDTEEVPA